MQVFIPYPEPMKVAQAMWADQKRYNKQIIECKQILAAIDGAKAWRNHPVCLMYKEHRIWLNYYMICLEYYQDYKQGFIECLDKVSKVSFYADKIRPSFITDELCNQHKRRLYTKAPELYPQFAEYGKSEVNFYFVNGKLLKYKNGKQIKE